MKFLLPNVEMWHVVRHERSCPLSTGSHPSFSVDCGVQNVCLISDHSIVSFQCVSLFFVRVRFLFFRSDQLGSLVLGISYRGSDLFPSVIWIVSFQQSASDFFQFIFLRT